MRGQGMAVPRWVVPLAVPWHEHWQALVDGLLHAQWVTQCCKLRSVLSRNGEDQSYNIHVFFGIAFQSFPTNITRDWYSISSWGRSSSDFLEPIPSPSGTEACFSHTSESSGDLRIHDDMTRLLSNVVFISFCVRIRSAAVYVSAKLYDVYDLFVGSPKKPDSEGYWRYWYEDLF